ncbi:MAG TPA: methyl-accepting chemotaxis protein [Desulfuromonadaceae bacterium]|jgi:methyl-accepting chemotaxis protein
MKISQKLIAGFACMVVLVVILGGVSFWGVNKINSEIETMYLHNTEPLPYIGNIGILFQRIRVNVRDAYLDKDVADRQKYIDKIGELKKEIDGELAKFEKSVASPKVREEFDALKKELAAFMAFGGDVCSLAKAGKDSEGQELIIKQCRSRASKVEDSIHKLNTTKIELAKEKYEASNSIATTLKTTAIILTLVSIMLAIVIGFLLTRSIVGPLGRMRAMIQDIAQGEGDLTKRLDASSKDELGETCHWFNVFVEKLQGIISQVAQTTSQVAAASNQLHTTAEQMATGAEQVAAQAGTVATAGEEMSATSGDMAQNCQFAAEGSQQASAAAVSGARVVDETIAVMNNIAERVRVSAKAVESLGTRSDQIGEIVGTIEDIADQTNLLALNAAIEAARAGEQGRGFAVVADEVRALAERTTRATREIGEMIKAIQSETKQAVTVMEEGVVEVGKGSEKAAGSGKALEQILEQINAVTAQVHQVATAAEEQTATTSEISNNMQQITGVIAQTARGAQESASAANQLSNLSEDLRKIVAQFKLV